MREAIETLGASRIREVANAGIGRDDVLAFWFGESDEVTPEPVSAGRCGVPRSAARPSMPTTWACRSCATPSRPT
jgi:hypothetical protein